MTERIIINIFSRLLERTGLFDLHVNEEYNYFCPKCERGIRYKQSSCKECKSNLTWIDNIEKQN